MRVGGYGGWGREEMREWMSKNCKYGKKKTECLLRVGGRVGRGIVGKGSEVDLDFLLCKC